MKRNIHIWEYAGEIMSALQKGILLTTRFEDRLNTMAVSWGTLGIEWGKPIFTVFVRENRFTRTCLEQNPEFTINVPYGKFDKEILRICGTRTGRDSDKIRMAGLTTEKAELVSVPAIRELPLTLECKVIYRQEQDPQAITEENKRRFYPQDVDGSYYDDNRDYHTAYYGEIVAAYIIE